MSFTLSALGEKCLRHHQQKTPKLPPRQLIYPPHQSLPHKSISHGLQALTISASLAIAYTETALSSPQLPTLHTLIQDLHQTLPIPILFKPMMRQTTLLLNHYKYKQSHRHQLQFHLQDLLQQESATGM